MHTQKKRMKQKIVRKKKSSYQRVLYLLKKNSTLVMHASQANFFPCFQQKCIVCVSCSCMSARIIQPCIISNADYLELDIILHQEKKIIHYVLSPTQFSKEESQQSNCIGTWLVCYRSWQTFLSTMPASQNSVSKTRWARRNMVKYRWENNPVRRQKRREECKTKICIPSGDGSQVKVGEEGKGRNKNMQFNCHYCSWREVVKKWFMVLPVSFCGWFLPKKIMRLHCTLQVFLKASLAVNMKTTTGYGFGEMAGILFLIVCFINTSHTW